MLAIALVAASVACTTTQTVAMSPTPPAADEKNVKIVGVETVDGERHTYREPARLAPGTDGPDLLVGQAYTEYQGSEAWTPLELEVSDIAQYELATEKKEMTEAGTLGALAFIGIFIAVLAKGIGDMNIGAGAFGCCS